MKDFHCCATCKNFKTEKTPEGMGYFCSRLGYETKPNYQFNCWDPKESIKKLIENEQNQKGHGHKE